MNDYYDYDYDYEYSRAIHILKFFGNHKVKYENEHKFSN